MKMLLRQAKIRMTDTLADRSLLIYSWIGGLWYRRHFQDVETYCMFIGYPRSGHTLIGALLDAHPNVVIAHELDALKFVQAGISRYRLYYLLVRKSRQFAEMNHRWNEYSYQVPNQWQGRFDILQVIRDKKGGLSTGRLSQTPQLLQDLQRTVIDDLKLIHVVRNPYDNITTIAMRDGKSIEWATDMYFSLCETVNDVKSQVHASCVLDVRHEELVRHPRESLHLICNFLGVDSPNEYLDDCASIVFDSPHRSRYSKSWEQELIAAVQEKIEMFAFLEGYSYGN